jgi:hypothetical protein
MNTRKAISHVVIAVCAMLTALGTGGCGGGVTTEPATAGNPAPVPAQNVIITLTTSGTLSGPAAIGGLGVTVNLPDTVSIRTTGGGNVDNGVVTASGVAAGQATVLALYSGATASTPAKLYLVLASGGSGLPVGQFATVTCEVNPGGDPVPSDFSLTDFSAVDTSGVSIPTLTAGLTEMVQ